MSVENPQDRNKADFPSIEILGKLKSLNTTEVDWGTRTAYDITIRSFDVSALMIATMKTGTILKIKVVPNNEPQKANIRRKQK